MGRTGGVACTVWVADLLWQEAIEYHRPTPSSIALWFVWCSIFASMEMESQPWNIQTGRWRITIGLAFVSVLAFAGFYYPYIKPSWGGGAASPATIYFTKDSPILPGRNVSAKIIDETDGGFYIIGGDDKKATFIPRSAVAMLYYSDDASGPFIVKSK